MRHLKKSYRKIELQVHITPPPPPLSLISGVQVSELYRKKTADDASFIIYLHPLTKVLIIILTPQRILYSTILLMTQLRYVMRSERVHYLLRLTLKTLSGYARLGQTTGICLEFAGADSFTSTNVYRLAYAQHHSFSIRLLTRSSGSCGIISTSSTVFTTWMISSLQGRPKRTLAWWPSWT